METSNQTTNQDQEPRTVTFSFPKLPRWSMVEAIGYEPKTTFWEDFSIADLYGISAIKDTFKRAFFDWQDDVEYIAEMALVLNHKGLFYYYASEQNDNNEHLRALSTLYYELYEAIDDYANKHFTGDDATYYFRVTD